MQIPISEETRNNQKKRNNIKEEKEHTHNNIGHDFITNFEIFDSSSNLDHLSCYITNCSNRKKSWIQKLHIKRFSKFALQIAQFKKP